jgi:hypothetical protein
MTRMRNGFVAAVLILAAGAFNPCAAQVPPTAARSLQRNMYDRFGHLRGTYLAIEMNNGDRFAFALPAAFLDWPVARQLNYLDARFGLGADRQMVGSILDSMNTNRQQLQLQQQLDRINQMSQPAWQPPPIPPIARPIP